MARHSTLLDAIKINEKLATVLRRVDEETCEYINAAITDAEIAKQLNVTKSAVQHVRRGCYGHLVGSHSSSNVLAHGKALAERVDALTARMAEAEDEIAQLTGQLVDAARQHVDVRDRLSKLCRELSLNKVCDVRHLDPNLAQGNAPPQAQANGMQQATRR